MESDISELVEFIEKSPLLKSQSPVWENLL